MNKKQKIRFFVICAIVIAVLAILSNIIKSTRVEETIQMTMKDAVLHTDIHIGFMGMKVNPGLISAFIVTGIFLIAGIIVRFFLVPRFSRIPGKIQIFLESVVGLFDNMARTNSPQRNSFLGAYIFTAGSYICISTLFELAGVQAINTTGNPVSLPAPLSDINGAIMMGCLSYLIILAGGLFSNGPKGMLRALKDFSLPISMSFRLFGALLSGALVTELVYYYPITRIAFPVIVGVLFTILHALIQAYVLTTLTAVFYGEASEKKEKTEKNEKPEKIRKTAVNAGKRKAA